MRCFLQNQITGMDAKLKIDSWSIKTEKCSIRFNWFVIAHYILMSLNVTELSYRKPQDTVLQASDDHRNDIQ